MPQDMRHRPSSSSYPSDCWKAVSLIMAIGTRARGGLVSDLSQSAEGQIRPARREKTVDCPSNVLQPNVVIP
jgi:hypothetical protein